MDARQGDACGSPLFSWICSEPSTTGAIDRGGRAHYTQPARRSIAGQVYKKSPVFMFTAVLTRGAGSQRPVPGRKCGAGAPNGAPETHERGAVDNGEEKAVC